MSAGTVVVSEKDHQQTADWDAPVRSSPLGHRMMFLLLMLLAFVLYAPTTLLPILQEHCQLLAEEARLQKVVAQLDDEIRRRDDLVKAFNQDNVINERLAMLDLHYAKPNEEVLPVLPPNYPSAKPPPVEAPPSRGAIALPDDWPPWALKAEQWADNNGLVGLFLDSSLRPIFYLMSAGLVVAAFLLFAPTRRRPRAAHRAPLSV